MNRRLLCLAVLAAAATGALAHAGSSGAAVAVVLSSPPDNVDLLSEADTQIDGALGSDRVGWRVTSGDVNGDGVGDTVIGSQSMTAYVLFGGLPALLDLSLFPATGFRIQGTAAGTEPEVVGDVNGDGKEDLLVSGGTNKSWVVFGKDDGATVSTSSLGNGGFGIVSQPGPRTVAFDGAGDVNGDGLDDIVFLDAAVDTAYVVFGKTTSSTVTLASLGSGGYRVTGASFGTLAAAGDVNRDGRGDMLLADFGFDGTMENVGRAWIVFGKANTTPVDVTGLGSSGYVIEGGAEGDQIGVFVANAGDVNGDGVPDQLIVHGTGRRASIVFGRGSGTKKITIATGGFRGYAIEAPAGASIDSIAGGADTNGDGLADQLIGDRDVDLGGRTDAGAAWVVFGKPDKETVSLDEYANGYRIDGPSAHAELTDVAFHTLGGSVHVLAGAWKNDANGRADSGSVYEVRDGSHVPFPIENATLSSSSERFLADTEGGEQPRLTFDALAAMRVQLALFRLTEGHQTRTGGCAKGTPRRAQRACVVMKRVRAASFVVTRPRRVSAPLQGSFPVGTYALAMQVTTRDGRVTGPFRAVFRVR
ncbi:MAG: VCBS repeat-containing protein [Thermoleophilia bacterium]